METIHKLPVPITDEFMLNLPLGTKILAVQMQGPQLCMWYLCDPAAPEGGRTFRVLGTGHPFPDASRCRYIGTVQQHSLVWHVFERVLA